MDIEREREDRFRFLRHVWDLTEADERKIVDALRVAEDLQLDASVTKRVVQYLKGEHLLVGRGTFPLISITHGGIQEVEDALSHPAAPTQHFPAVNLIQIETMSNSVIQQGSPGATQQVQLGQEQLDALPQLIAEIHARLDQLQLGTDELSQVKADLATLEAQLSAPQPKHTILRESLASLRSVLENAAGAIIAAPIVFKIGLLLGAAAA